MNIDLLEYDNRKTVVPWFERIGNIAMAQPGLAQIAMSIDMMDNTIMSNARCNPEWRAISMGSILFDVVVTRHVSVSELFEIEQEFVQSGRARNSLSLGDKGRNPLPPKPARGWTNGGAAVRDSVIQSFDSFLGFIITKMTTATIDALNLMPEYQAARSKKDIIALMDSIKLRCMIGDDDIVTARMEFEGYIRDPRAHGLGQEGSVDSYINGFMSVYSMLRGAGSHLEQSFVVAGFIKGLDAEYDDFRTVLVTTGAPIDLPSAIERVRKLKSNKRMFASASPSDKKSSAEKRQAESTIEPRAQRPAPSPLRYPTHKVDSILHAGEVFDADHEASTAAAGSPYVSELLQRAQQAQQASESRLERLLEQSINIFASSARTQERRETAQVPRQQECFDWIKYGRCHRLENKQNCRYAHPQKVIDAKQTEAAPVKRSIFGNP